MTEDPPDGVQLAVAELRCHYLHFWSSLAELRVPGLPVQRTR